MRYKAIADQYIEDIQTGRLKPEQRLPSLRRLAELHNVSMTTALNCYHLLEELGWATARPQAGYFAAKPFSEQQGPKFPAFQSKATDPCRADDEAPSAADNILPHSRLYNDSRDRQPGPLGVSLLAPELLPTEALARSLRRASQLQGEQVHYYPEPQGHDSLRRALQGHFSRYDFHFAADQLVISNGCLDAIHGALSVTTQPGDVVAISSPCFSGLLDLLAQMGRQVLEIPSTEQGLDLQQLEQHMRAKTISAGLFSTSHMNPQGISLSAQQKRQLAEMANRYKVPIIEDDVYLELGHGQAVPLPAKHWDKHGYVLWCGSVSKTLTAGYRLGWCLPGRYFKSYLQLRNTQSFGVSSPIQLTVAEFINSGQYQKHLRKTRLALARQLQSYYHWLQQQLPDNARISTPGGGMVLWIQLPGLDSAELDRQAKIQGIDIRIGSNFSTLGHYKDCFRINFGWPLQTELQQSTKAAEQLEGLLQLVRKQLAH